MNMADGYRQKIYDIAVNIFEITCCMFPLEEWELENRSGTPPEGNTQAAVSFNGAAEGEMIIAPSEELLTAIAGNMLGVEDPGEELKSGALCEIANIICGNVVPLFANNEKICYINPPHIIEAVEAVPKEKKSMKKESFLVFLDEGSVKITIYYSLERKS